MPFTSTGVPTAIALTLAADEVSVSRISPVLRTCPRLKYTSTPAATHIRRPKSAKIRVSIVMVRSSL
jgi:hypothetical protein